MPLRALQVSLKSLFPNLSVFSHLALHRAWCIARLPEGRTTDGRADGPDRLFTVTDGGPHGARASPGPEWQLGRVGQTVSGADGERARWAIDGEEGRQTASDVHTSHGD